ncbi:MAG: hypothetical protein K6T91_05650 [Firmicutes bacterium]|nr:hypothetical protein [Bacillota bacterium]
MPHDILSEKRLISLLTKNAVEEVEGVSLVQESQTGPSYPYHPDVPGVWVHGPDQSASFAVSVNIVVMGISVPEAAKRIRSAIMGELRSRNLINLVKEININVKDWAKTA